MAAQNLDEWVNGKNSAMKYYWTINQNQDLSSFKVYFNNRIMALNSDQVKELSVPFVPLVKQVKISFPVKLYEDEVVIMQLMSSTGITPLDMLQEVAKFYRERPAVVNEFVSMIYFEGFAKFYYPDHGIVYNLILGS